MLCARARGTGLRGKEGRCVCVFVCDSETVSESMCERQCCTLQRERWRREGGRSTERSEGKKEGVRERAKETGMGCRGVVHQTM